MENNPQTTDQAPAFGDRLAQFNGRTVALLGKGRQIPGLSSNRFEDWMQTCRHIETQISEDLIRVAVVGSIKSGKSTFANALLGGDYLKRGAGVVTSMVTRVHHGEPPAAKLYLKSWDEINADIAQAMVLMPHVELPAEERFDLRKQEHRDYLKGALEKLGSRMWTAEGTVDINGMLLRSYLAGYDEVAELVAAESTTLAFGPHEIARHREFSGHDRCAVYLQDILLHLNTPGLLPHVELADCQGSDSPNPLHLAMIQEYLRLANLIIYVISSRTGLRRADIRFLSMIKKMGLLSNLIFIINCDFSEHESFDELQKLISRTRRELTLLEIQPEIYAPSALFKLFQTLGAGLSQKDGQRMVQWRQEAQFVEFAEGQWDSFEREFKLKVTRERYALFTQSHLTRLKGILNGLTHWTEMNRDLLSRDMQSVRGIGDMVRQHRAKIDKLQNMLQSTLDGEVERVKKELRQAVDRFFDDRNGQVLGALLAYVRQYPPAYETYQEQLAESGLSATLYTLFQDFRRSVDTYMTETVNPEILRFIQGQESGIQGQFKQVADPYQLLAADALLAYNSAIQDLGLPPLQAELDKQLFSVKQLERIKRLSKLAPPPAQNTMHYSAKIRSDAILRLGFYTALQFFKRLLKKEVSQGGDRMQALKDGVRGIKRETERSLRGHFKDYRENLKFQYLNKLAERVSAYLADNLKERLKLYDTDLSGVEGLLQGRDEDRQGVIHQLEALHTEARQLKTSVTQAEEEIATLAASRTPPVPEDRAS
ncbi:MAG: dynamin family protein [Desulfobacterales bacterium]